MSENNLVDHDVEQGVFSKMGRTYQERVVQALLSDHLFAEQMADVLDPKFFDMVYLTEISKKYFDYRVKYKHFPSTELLWIMLKQDEDAGDVMLQQVADFMQRINAKPLNGDARYIQETSLDFCKKMALKGAILKSVEKLEESDYDAIQTLIKDAMTKGASTELGHDYVAGLGSRVQRSERKPISTGWPVMDKALNGGWERKILVTFIAPTGAGKSMFLVNVAGAGIAQGLNVLYVTCEMADYKIGLRLDSYFSGKAINDIPSFQDDVQKAVDDNVKGKLIIKEWPTKQATVQTIRSHIQRLQATKNFTPDMLVVDYADLLRSTRGYGEKRHELESVYEDLRALGQEFNMVVVTADQTNRSGLNDEIVTLQSIAESYAKATVCDVIVTISRRMEDKLTHSGRLYLAKSRLGQDGIVFPFKMNTATVRATIFDQGTDPTLLFMENKNDFQGMVSKRFGQLSGSKKE